MFARYQLDGIVMPTTPCPAGVITDNETVAVTDAVTETAFAAYTRFTSYGTLVGAPGSTLPLRAASGLPVGLAIDGLPGRDTELLEVAARVEALLSGVPRRL